ncbi:BtpA/SgcQ family protein [Candidatus Woesearchaeota archaeon]|nr:BtpA/SgcQ family protein [Candidatus Woesearchaeota archaeon]
MKVIGMIHLTTLPGYPQHSSMEDVMGRAVEDAVVLEQGGVDAILIENTDDDPHQKAVSPETVAAFTAVALEVRRTVKIPVGICVLWNDYRAALAIAKVCGAEFVRIPVFTEAVVTASGLIEGNPFDAVRYRRQIGADDIRIMADVQVKHASMLAKRPIAESAVEAAHFGADELIVTGRFTGDSPDMEDLKKVRLACPDATITIGSGTTPQNFGQLALYADKAIVGTYFKPKGKIELERIREVVALRDAAR